MRLVLLQPPVEDFYDTDVRLQPIGLCYLKAAVRAHLPHVEVIVRDYHAGWGRQTVALPDELDYLRPYYFVADRSPFSTFDRYYRFGADPEHVAADVARLAPTVVGISSLFSPYYREALRCAEAIKRRLEVPVIVGGAHASALPEQMLSHPAVDFVIRGEGERPLVELLRALASGSPDLSRVPNLGFKRAGELVLNPLADNFAIDAIPEPDLTDLDPARYRHNGRPLCFVITSRGCPHRCSFCSVHTTFGFAHRRRSVDAVLAELVRRYAQGYRVFDFEDDNLTFYLDQMKQLCRALIARFPQRDVELVAMNGISYLSLDRELLELMREAGFKQLNLSLVSSDTTVRASTERPHTLQKYLDVVAHAHRLGLRVVSYQIFGLPEESLDSMIATLCCAARLPVLLGASVFYLTPGSPIAARLDAAPTPAAALRSRLSAMAIETAQVRRQDLYTLFITTRIINFLKGCSLPSDNTPLSALLATAPHQPPRQRLGLELLARLLREGQLYAMTRQGPVLRDRFDVMLFQRIWAELGSLGTQRGQHLLLNED